MRRECSAPPLTRRSRGQRQALRVPATIWPPPRRPAWQNMSVALPTTAGDDHRARSARQPPMTLVVVHPVVLVARGFCERIAVEAPHRPSILGDRAARAIELLRRPVPIEHRPFHPRPAALDREPGHPLEKRLTHALTAKALGHEEVF